MTKQKTKPIRPDFILYDMDIPSKFAQMCQNFQKEFYPPKHPESDWLVIDNETGQIITSQKNHT